MLERAFLRAADVMQNGSGCRGCRRLAFETKAFEL